MFTVKFTRRYWDASPDRYVTTSGYLKGFGTREAAEHAVTTLLTAPQESAKTGMYTMPAYIENAEIIEELHDA